jgi:pimeloyl-ACP methyl ester carboxylesterase
MRLERRIDVGAAAALGQPVEMAATIFLPDVARLPQRPVAVFAVPGGGYSRGYFDLQFPGRPGYSEAEYHVARGLIHVAIDHVGVGDSTIPDLSKITFDTLAATHDSCVRQIAALLEQGLLSEDFPACPDLFKVGMGQSMGGGVSILAQGRFATFEAIAPCGVSALHTVLPQRTRAEFEHGKARFDGVLTGEVRSHDTMSHEGVDYIYPFHWEDVPADILQADMEGGYPVRRTAPAFGSLTIPHCAVQMMTPGCFKPYADRITSPVFIGLGERDTCPDPHAEPSGYPRSPDVSLFVVPTMAHMHNFASTRMQLWARLHRWARLVSQPV